MILQPKNTLSFNQYKSRLKHLEDEQLELVQALKNSTDALIDAQKSMSVMYKKLCEFIDEKEIEKLLSE